MVDFCIISLVVTFCAYVLVDRVCTCFEKCSSNHACGDVFKEVTKNARKEN